MSTPEHDSEDDDDAFQRAMAAIEDAIEETTACLLAQPAGTMFKIHRNVDALQDPLVHVISERIVQDALESLVESGECTNETADVASAILINGEGPFSLYRRAEKPA